MMVRCPTEEEISYMEILRAVIKEYYDFLVEVGKL